MVMAMAVVMAMAMAENLGTLPFEPKMFPVLVGQERVLQDCAWLTVETFDIC